MELPINLAIDTTENWEKGDTVLGESELAIEIAGKNPDGSPKVKYLLIGDGKPVGPGAKRLRATAELIAGLPETLKGLAVSLGAETARAIGAETRLQEEIEGEAEERMEADRAEANYRYATDIEEAALRDKGDKAEKERAQKEEKRLDGKIDSSLAAEKERAQKEEKRLDGKIDTSLAAETKRATGEEQRLDGKIDSSLAAEKERAQKEEKRLDGKIDTSLAAETKRATGEEQRLEKKFDTGLVTERDRAIEEEKRIEGKTDAETTRAAAAEKKLGDALAAETRRAENTEERLDSAMAAETRRAKDAEAALDGNKINKSAAGEEKTLIQEIRIKEITPNSFVVVYKNRNVESGKVTETEVEFPQASEQKSGMMPAERFALIDEHSLRIDGLERRGVHYTVTLARENPTEEELRAAYEAASGNTGTPPDQTTLDDSAYGKSYTFYGTQGKWVDKGDTSIVLFSNSTPGLIKGDNKEGKVFAEEDGTGSVVGWDGLKAQAFDNAKNIATKAPADAALTAETGTGTDTTTPAVPFAPVASIIQTVWKKIRLVVNVLNGKAPIVSPAFTGTPTVPNKTSAATNNGKLIASEAQVYSKVSKNFDYMFPQRPAELVGNYYYKLATVDIKVGWQGAFLTFILQDTDNSRLSCLVSWQVDAGSIIANTNIQRLAVSPLNRIKGYGLPDLTSCFVSSSPTGKYELWVKIVAREIRPIISILSEYISPSSTVTWHTDGTFADALPNNPLSSVPASLNIPDDTITDALIGNRVLDDLEGASALPRSGNLTTLLQAIRNCLKYLVDKKVSLEQVYNILTSQIPTRITSIPAGTDLNSITTPGFYNCTAVATIINLPPGVDPNSNFILEVLTFNNSSDPLGSVIMQRVTNTSNSLSVFKRTKIYKSLTWTSWIPLNDPIPGQAPDYPILIPAGADLNNYSTGGYYGWDSASINSITNKPEDYPSTTAGYMYVNKINNIALEQRIVSFETTNRREWQRTYAGTWGNWKLIVPGFSLVKRYQHNFHFIIYTQNKDGTSGPKYYGTSQFLSNSPTPIAKLVELKSALISLGFSSSAVVLPATVGRVQPGGTTNDKIFCGIFGPSDNLTVIALIDMTGGFNEYPKTIPGSGEVHDTVIDLGV